MRRLGERPDESIVFASSGQAHGGLSPDPSKTLHEEGAPSGAREGGAEQALVSKRVIADLMMCADGAIIMGAALLKAGIDLTHSLDDRFSLPKKTTLSQRDVPGMTRAVVPLLARRGVKALSVGENQQCAPVNVPPIFLWKDNRTDTAVIAM